MKVCTDACLFGAYIANEIQQLPVKNILDIGTGTGLLTLMLAQETSAAIDAVEIDAAAFTQAKQNIEQSPWKEKIAIYNSDILKFQTNKKYDCIISNPPFFEADLKSTDEKKNFAKHDTSLTFTALLNIVDANLSADGFFAVLLPFHRSNYFEEEAVKINFHLAKKILIKQTPKHNHFRSILVFSRIKTATVPEELIIKNEDGNYTVEFISLLKDYYLYL
jgi:tRNA1Val (adenine37-N6)-methyltransferase